jgi:PAS domain S-box-containing protein
VNKPKGKDKSSDINYYHALTTSESFFRSMLEQTKEMLFVHTLEGEIVDVNEAAIEELGYSRKELLSMTIFDLDPNAAPKKHKELLWQRDFSIQKTVRIESPHRRKDGSIYLARVNINKITSQNREFIFALARNLTPEKLSKEEFQIAQNTSFEIIETIPSGFFIYQYQDPDKLYLLHVNPEAKKHVRSDIDSLLGKEFDELWPETKKSTLKKDFLQVLQTTSTFESEEFPYKDEQTQGVFRIRAFCLSNERLAVTFTNSSRLIEAEEKLHENEQILNAFFEHSPIHLFIKDEYQSIVKLSKSMETFFDKPIEMLINKNMVDLLEYSKILSKEHITSMIQNDLSVLMQQSITESEDVIANKIFRTIKFPIIVGQNKLYVAGFKIDISQQKAMEKSIQSQLDELNRFKKLTIDRELKMIELKKEVNELLKDQHKEEKYRIIE